MFNGFYKGLSDDRKEYLYGQQVYIPEACPDHYYNTNKFSPAFLAEIKKKDDDFLNGCTSDSSYNKASDNKMEKFLECR